MKKLSKILNLMLLAGAILLVGTAGASDCGQISLSQMLLQGGSAVLLIFAALGGKWLVTLKMKRNRLRQKRVRLIYAV